MNERTATIVAQKMFTTKLCKGYSYQKLVGGLEAFTLNDSDQNHITAVWEIKDVLRLQLAEVI